MKQIFFPMFFLWLVTPIRGQVKDSLQLAEVTVSGARVVKKADATLFYPTNQQKESSTNGYGLLARTALPHLRIDEVAHTIMALGNKGDVQIRLNGILCGQDELLALDPKSVKRIEFMDNPGLRYGDGVGYVINIITMRQDAGYTLGLDATNSVTALADNNFAFTHLNRGISEWGAAYTFNYQDLKKSRTSETSEYLLPDGTLKRIGRNDIDGRQKSLNHAFQLYYNAVKTDHYVFQAKLNGSLQQTPGNYRHIIISETSGDYKATENETGRTLSPNLDLYLQNFFGKEQVLTTNIVGTYIYTKENNFYNEGGPYAYTIHGKSYSLIGESIYENQLRPFKLSSGVQYNLKLTNNQYAGDAQAHDLTHRSTVYLFGQLSGKLGAFTYTGGLGYSFLQFSQGDYKYHFDLFRPKASLTYTNSKGFTLSYSFEISQRVSQIAMTNNVSIRQNSMEWLKGNPEIRPTSRTEQILQLSYNKPHFSTTLEGFYRTNRHTNMGQYTRQTEPSGDTYYIYSQKNQGSINMFYITEELRFDIIPDKLSLNGQAGIYRFINRGDDYRHYYTAFNGSASVNAYLGALTLSAYADNGWKFMEGENRGHNGPATYLAASYRLGNFMLSAYWQHLFQNNPRLDKSEILNRYVHKVKSINNGDFGNMVSIGISWNLHRGKHYKEIQCRLHYEDKDSGILK